jgi:hypothetical protein
LLDVTRQKIPVTENGKTRRMPALEVMLRTLTNEAVQNDQAALKLIFTLMERYGDPTETTIAPNRNEVLAEDQEILERYLEKLSPPAAKQTEKPDKKEN